MLRYRIPGRTQHRSYGTSALQSRPCPIWLLVVPCHEESFKRMTILLWLRTLDNNTNLLNFVTLFRIISCTRVWLSRTFPFARTLFFCKLSIPTFDTPLVRRLNTILGSKCTLNNCRRFIFAVLKNARSFLLSGRHVYTNITTEMKFIWAKSVPSEQMSN